MAEWRSVPALLAFICISLALIFPTAARNSNTVNLGLLPIMDNLPFYVAEAKGLYRKYRVDVKLVPFSSAIERDMAYRSGAVDGGVGDILAAALMEDTDTDISIISLSLGAAPQEGRFAVLASPKAKFKRLRDLRNVPIGISGNSIIEYVTDRLMAETGVSEKDVAKLDIPKLPVRTEMLLSGKLQAAVLPDPMAAYALARGARLIADDTSKNLSQSVIFFTARSLKAKSKEIVQLMKAYGEAVRLINRNPEDYRELLVEVAKIPDLVKKKIAIDHYPVPQLPLARDIESVVKWMSAKGLLKGTVRYKDLIDPGFILEKAK